MEIFELLGFAGSILVALAYFPQIMHLIVKRCTAGISLLSWVLWLIAGVLILLHAVHQSDRVFIVLQIITCPLSQ